MSIKQVVQQLRKSKHQAEKELSGIMRALEALKKPAQSVLSGRHLSVAARKRISVAQKMRWAAVRKNGKKAA